MSEDNVDQALIDIAHNYERGVMRRHLTGGKQRRQPRRQSGKHQQQQDIQHHIRPHELA